MKYSECIADVKKWFPGSRWGAFVGHKPTGKRLAESLRIPVPRSFHAPPQGFVVKPAEAFGSRGLVLIDDPQNWVVEELQLGSNGRPALDWKIYTFGGEPKMVTVIERDHGREIAAGRFWYPSWEPVPEGLIKRRVRWLDAEPVDPGMIGYARRLACVFPIPIRCDFYLTARGPVFGELCATSGIWRRLTPPGDELLGSWWVEDRELIERGCQKHPPSEMRMPQVDVAADARPGDHH